MKKIIVLLFLALPAICLGNTDEIKDGMGKIQSFDTEKGCKWYLYQNIKIIEKRDGVKSCEAAGSKWSEPDWVDCKMKDGSVIRFECRGLELWASEVKKVE